MHPQAMERGWTESFKILRNVLARLVQGTLDEAAYVRVLLIRDWRFVLELRIGGDPALKCFLMIASTCSLALDRGLGLAKPDYGTAL